jgi:hypothetical protein
MSNIFESLGSGIFNGISNAKDKVGNGLRSIPQFFESNVVKPISNSMGQQVAKFAGIQNANPQRGFFNTLSDIDNKIKFTASNSPGQNNGMISPKGWTPPQGATVGYNQQRNPEQTTVTQIGQTTPTYIPQVSNQNNYSQPVSTQSTSSSNKNNLSSFVQSIINELKSGKTSTIPQTQPKTNIPSTIQSTSVLPAQTTSVGVGETLLPVITENWGSNVPYMNEVKEIWKDVDPNKVINVLFGESSLQNGINANVPKTDKNGNIMRNEKGNPIIVPLPLPMPKDKEEWASLRAKYPSMDVGISKLNTNDAMTNYLVSKGLTYYDLIKNPKLNLQIGYDLYSGKIPGTAAGIQNWYAARKLGYK